MSEYKIVVVNNSSKPGTYVVFQAPPSGVAAPTNWSVRETIEAGGSAEVSFTPPPPKPVGLFAKLRALLFGAPRHATPDHFHLAVEAEGEVGPHIDFPADATASTKIVHGLDGGLSVAAVSTLGYSVFDTPAGNVAPTDQGDNFIAAYSIMAIFTNSAGPSCASGEYRQFVKGQFSVDGSVVSHILCGSTMLSPSAWQEDGCPPTCTAYGYRTCAPSAWNQYTPIQMTSAQYTAYDQPGFHNIHPGYTYSIDLQYQGELLDTAVGATLAARSWSVEGQFAAPTVALVDAPQGLQPSDRLVGAHLSRNLANNGPEVHVLIARVHGSPRLDPNAVKVVLVDAEGQAVTAAEPVAHEVGGQRGTTATIVHRLLPGQATPAKATLDIDGQVTETPLAGPVTAWGPPSTDPLLPGCVTIDASVSPYLNNARAGNPTAGASTSTQAAVSNLLACAGQSRADGQASLIGRGAEGVFEINQATGEVISLQNQATWAPVFQQLAGRFPQLFLYGAQVGAGEDGAQLLYSLAKAANAVVYAPTGLIYCSSDGSFYLEAGAVWQSATPGGAPAPIDPPQRVAPQAQPIAPAPYTAQVTDPSGAEWDSASAEALAAEVLWKQPLQPNGEPGALVTGRMVLTFTNPPAVKSFVIYDNGLLRDEVDPNTYYATTPSFRRIVQSHSRA